MWVVDAPFDGEAGDVNFQKSKLLKPNSSYIVGRKDRDLTIHNKRVSADHCEFIVGDHTVDDASEPSIIPSLKVINRMKKDKKLNVIRGNTSHIIEYGQSFQLQHGDQVSVLSGTAIQVGWIPLCAYSAVSRGKGSISIATCASLGIKLLFIPHPEITHHLISHYVANLSTATSLLTLSRFVKPEWLQEVLRLGELPRNHEDTDGTSLEDHFVMPPETKFRPSFSPALLPSQKQFDIWEPNEERVKLFHTCRFICLQEKVRASDSEIKDAIHQGGGILETFDIHSGVVKFNRAITRSQAKEGKKTVVIGDADLMQLALGKEAWNEFVAEAKNFTLAIVSPSKIIQAVLEVNVDLLFPVVSIPDATSPKESVARNSSPLPEMAPNTIPSEPSIRPDEASLKPPTEPRKLIRRAPSRAPSTEPSIPSTFSATLTVDESLLRPRRGLTRRYAGPNSIVTGLEGDSSDMIDGVPELPKRPKTPPRKGYDLTAPTPARTSRLKRRAIEGGILLDSEPPQTVGIEETVGEPPLKKFKALFEASNPAGPSGESYEVADSIADSIASQTQTQSETHSRPPRSMGFSNLAILREEEEEATQSGVGTVPGQRGQKRRLESVEEDAEMRTPSDTAEALLPATKKRAMENVNAVEQNPATNGLSATTNARSKPPTTISTKQAHGAAAGKPDTDTAFLKAIASNKRGKKTEDEFDREFNKLKISKPELDTHEPEQEWAVLADFGDDSGLRGNFMTIVELDLYQKDPSQVRNSNPTWNGKENFKKFKKKIISSRPKIELFLSGGDDYEMDTAYWKGENSQSQNQDTQFGSQNYSQPKRETSRKAASRPLDSDDEAPVHKTRKPSSRSAVEAPTKKAPAKKKRVAKSATALFLDSDSDIQEIKEDDFDKEPARDDAEQDETLHSSVEEIVAEPRRPTRATKAPAKVKKPAPVVIDSGDDSDDGAVFKGSKGRR